MRRNAIVMAPSDSRYGDAFDADTQRAMRLVREEEDRRILQAWFDADTKIKAIKNVRELTGCGLKEAKDTVEERLAKELFNANFVTSEIPQGFVSCDGRALDVPRPLLASIFEAYGGEESQKYILLDPEFEEEHPGFVDVTPRGGIRGDTGFMSYAGLKRIAGAMSAPLRKPLDYRGAGRSLVKMDDMPELPPRALAQLMGEGAWG
jgi:hypothetical protein